MKKLLIFFFLLSVMGTYAQNTWTEVNPGAAKGKTLIHPTAQDENQRLFTFDQTTFKTALAGVTKRFSGGAGVLITLPTSKGTEQFRVWEKSNFAPELQAKYPDIRAYIGKGVTDPTATAYFSLDPRGIQVMVLRANGSEFIEPYTKDHSVYVLFESGTRTSGALPLTCRTEEVALQKDLSATPQMQARMTDQVFRSFRLALSCTGEYTVYHGGTVAGALAAMNATMTRVNGVYDIDLALELIMIANNDDVIYTSASSDPYSPASGMNNWNSQLQNTLTSVIGEANYDLGHLFGATGGGGNAGCIGCVCDNNQKGSGITSPNDGIPEGDTFDIDYVAHEMGHQLGGTHSYSVSFEGSGTNVEPGSGSTIMGYAGITGSATDVQSNSDDYFTYANIAQIEANLQTKSCATETTLSNTPPIVNAGSDYIIPRGTPFILTGSATDAEGDALTYCWEQFDDATDATSGNASIASGTKAVGPTFRSFDPVAVPFRYFPAMSRIKANAITSSFESVSNVARDLNFTLTVRDNNVNGGQTQTDAMKVTVNDEAGPFVITAPNTAVSLTAGTNTNITWNVAGTTANGINTPTVDIYFSTDTGNTYPTLLASDVPNDGSEVVTIPDSAGSGRRIMVKGHNHIFFDISNTNFTVLPPAATQAISFNGVAGEQNKSICPGTDSVSYTIAYSALAGFSGTTTFSATGNPAGTTVNFQPSSMTASGNVTMTVSGLNAATAGLYTIAITSTSGAVTKTMNTYLGVGISPATLVAPVNLATPVSTSPALTWQAATNATSYDVQVASDAAFTTIVASGTTTATSYTVTGLLQSTTYYWRVRPNNAICTGVYGNAFQFQTGQINCATSTSTNIPVTISANAAATVNSTLAIASGVTIADLNAYVRINHSYVEDLTVTLISPAGTEVQLLSGVCGSSNNINATFDDAGTTLVCAGGTPVVTGTIKPSQNLSTFNGESSTGTWTLRVQDAVQGDGGSIVQWNLNICSVGPALGLDTPEALAFSVYPNPSNGLFTIQSDKVTSAKVDVMVYDMQGRTIFNRSFDGEGAFRQDIRLENAQAGVYLLSLNDGGRKTVKRIVVE